MPLSLKQRFQFHKKRSFDMNASREDRFFSVGYVSGTNLFSPMWSESQKRAAIKERAKRIKEVSSYRNPSVAEKEDMFRAKGLMSYASDLAKDKKKKGLSLFDKEIRKR